VHIPLAELLDMDGSTVLVNQCVSALRAHRARASGGDEDVGAWLNGDAAEWPPATRP